MLQSNINLVFQLPPFFFFFPPLQVARTAVNTQWTGLLMAHCPVLSQVWKAKYSGDSETPYMARRYLPLHVQTANFPCAKSRTHHKTDSSTDTTFILIFCILFDGFQQMVHFTSYSLELLTCQFSVMTKQADQLKDTAIHHEESDLEKKRYEADALLQSFGIASDVSVGRWLFYNCLTPEEFFQSRLVLLPWCCIPV